MNGAIVSSVKEEVVVGIMTVPLKKYGEDMVTESQFTHINLENINPGSIIERLNGNNLKLMPLWRNW